MGDIPHTIYIIVTEDAKVKQKSEENTMKKLTRRFEDAKIQVCQQVDHLVYTQKRVTRQTADL